jgi:REP element-mobilizing transposase RayT
MGRPKREFDAGGIYHLGSRGSNRGLVFRYDGDRQAFLDRVANVTRRYELRWIAYCLMGNHYHAIVQTPDSRLSPAMRDLHGGFSRLCRSIYGRDAHLFKNRFWCEPIDSPQYFITAMSYLDLNPVRAGLCCHPAEWPWGSYRATVGLERPLAFLAPEIFLRGISPDLDMARKEYAHLIDAAVTDLPIVSGV